MTDVSWKATGSFAGSVAFFVPGRHVRGLEGVSPVYSLLQPLDPAQVWAVAVAVMIWIATGLGGVMGGSVGG